MVRRGGGDHVDRIAERRLGRQELRENGSDVRRQLGNLDAVRLAGICAQNSRAARIGDDGDPSAAWYRLGTQERGGAKQLMESIRPDHPRLLEQRVHVTSEAESSAPVCEMVARAPAADRPLLTASSGLRRANLRAPRANLRGFPKDSRYSSATSVAASSFQ